MELSPPSAELDAQLCLDGLQANLTLKPSHACDMQHEYTRSSFCNAEKLSEYTQNPTRALSPVDQVII